MRVSDDRALRLRDSSAPSCSAHAQTVSASGDLRRELRWGGLVVSGGKVCRGFRTSRCAERAGWTSQPRRDARGTSRSQSRCERGKGVGELLRVVWTWGGGALECEGGGKAGQQRQRRTLRPCSRCDDGDIVLLLPVSSGRRRFGKREQSPVTRRATSACAWVAPCGRDEKRDGCARRLQRRRAAPDTRSCCSEVGFKGDALRSQVHPE